MIQFSYENCLKEKIAENGLDTSQLDALKGKLESAHQALREKLSRGELGFAELPDATSIADRITEFASVNREKYDNFVVLGIGGSALGSIALQTALHSPFYNLLPRDKRNNCPRIFILDNIDPDLISAFLDTIDATKTLFNVITKSGSTSETISQFFIIRGILEKELGKNYKEHIVATTDPKKGLLREIATREGYTTFDIPPNVGGRFSVLSPVGLLSAAISGIDIHGLLKGAQEMRARCSEQDITINPAYAFAAIHYLFYNAARPIHIMFSYSQRMKDFADWFRQLWAESLGKRLDNSGKEVFIGPTPVKALGVTDQHSQAQLYIEGPQDKVITFISVEKPAHDVPIPKFENHFLGGQGLCQLFHAEEKATRAALTRRGRPNCTITLPSITPESVGEFIYMLELATACAGELFGINAFDQPGVELGKNLTYGLMGRPGYEQYRSQV